MPFYNWDPKLLSVKVDDMDREHQVLIDKMNKVYDAANAGADKATLQPLVDDFAGYTVKHFADEEAYMEKIGFEGVKTHKLIHQQLLGQVKTHLDEFAKTGKLSPSFFNFLGVWLTSHIRGIDAKYSSGKKAA